MAASAWIAVRNDIILRLLRRERASCRLCVEAQPERARILRSESLMQRARPDASRGAVFRHFLEQIVVRVEEKTESRRKLIDMQSALDGRLDVCQPVGEGERQFLRGGCACFTNVIAADRYRIPLRHMAGGELDGIDDQTHGWFGREDILVLGDVFLQNIVLKRAAQLAPGDAALLRHHQVHCPDNCSRRVDRHRGADLVERQPIEQYLHIGKRGDCHATLAELAGHQRIVGITPVECGHIERD
jgi:hypothetical protein